MKHILMFTFATENIPDSFARMFTNGTRGCMVSMVTYATRITNVTKLPVATMVTDEPHGYIPSKITSFVNTTNPGVG